MGAVMLGGMALSTPFTLILVPTMCSLRMDVRAGLWSLLGSQPQALNGNGNSHGNRHGNGDCSGQEIALTAQARTMNDP
jgi:hypothetical protein